jgi:twitching motility protein PilJ
MADSALTNKLMPILEGLGDKLGQWLGNLFGRWAKADPDQLPLVGKLPAQQRQPLLTVVMILSLLTALTLLVWYTVQVGNRAEYVEIATRLQMLSQRYTKTVQQAALGNQPAFAQLEESRKSFADGLDTLINGGAGVPASPRSLQPRLAELKKRWDVSKVGIQTVLAQQGVLVNLNQALNQINARNTELLDLTEQVVALLPGGAKSQLDFAHQQSLWTQRMAKNANALISSDVINPESAYQLGQDLQTFREVLRGLLEGNPNLSLAPVSDADTREKLLELKEAFASFETQVNTILKSMPQLVQAKRAARDIFDESERLLVMTRDITGEYQSLGAGFTLVIALALGLLALYCLVLLGVLTVSEARLRAEEAARENRRNQDAILRLLNEMGDLAEGDLTVQATVTEDITGAIADSVNYAIEELRMLVQNINRAADQVSGATQTAQQTAGQMAAGAEEQSRRIAETTEAVSQITESIVHVSQNAAESARVADQSLDTARKGGDSVRNAIAGMNQLRDQIQETSKRIKRLGESSQEIGGIVELISDLTEQTNVLALNAAIQAAAAGEAGRGFTVVAEEVQRLAERSAGATRRIGAIVKTIQSDTQDAVNAMELSTRGVVEGTALSDAAGGALREIESVSERLARLIQNISEATQSQAQTAENIAGIMRQIQDLTGRAAGDARGSAESIGQLAALSNELKVSVSGFKL